LCDTRSGRCPDPGKDLKITLRNIELNINTLLLLFRYAAGKMEQRGMTHSRKQALADHAIAGCTFIRPHVCDQVAPVESANSRIAKNYSNE